MSTHELNRRGLLGLLAAAPVVAAARVDAAPHRVKFAASIREVAEVQVRLHAIYNHPLGMTGCTGTPGDPGVSLENHPLEGLSHSPSDGEGPGAPVETTAKDPRCVSARTGAPAPDSENPILKHARAC